MSQHMDVLEKISYDKFEYAIVCEKVDVTVPSLMSYVALVICIILAGVALFGSVFVSVDTHDATPIMLGTMTAIFIILFGIHGPYVWFSYTCGVRVSGQVSGGHIICEQVGGDASYCDVPITGDTFKDEMALKRAVNTIKDAIFRDINCRKSSQECCRMYKDVIAKVKKE